MQHVPSTPLSKLALTTGLMVTVGSAAHATIIYTLNTPVTLTPPNNGANGGVLQFNVATGAYGFGTAGIANPQFQISYAGNSFPGKPQLQGLSTSPTSQVLYSTSNGNDYVTQLPTGTVNLAGFRPVDGTYGNGIDHVPYLSFNRDQYSQFKPGVGGYTGFHIADPNVPGQTDFGIAYITYNNDESITLSSLAYDNAGIAPEPSTLATSLVALGGAAGCALARRRRRAKSHAV